MILIKKKCIKCGEIRKFVKDSERDKKSICGNCWDWEEEAKKWPECPYCRAKLNPEMLKIKK